MRADRMFWNGSGAPTEYELVGTVGEANLVGSQLPSGLHAPVLDLDTASPVVVPSSTPGHYHLYLDGVELTTEEYSELLDVLCRLGIIERGFANQLPRLGQTFLRPPGFTKCDDDWLWANTEKGRD